MNPIIEEMELSREFETERNMVSFLFPFFLFIYLHRVRSIWFSFGLAIRNDIFETFRKHICMQRRFR